MSSGTPLGRMYTLCRLLYRYYANVIILVVSRDCRRATEIVMLLVKYYATTESIDSRRGRILAR